MSKRRIETNADEFADNMNARAKKMNRAIHTGTEAAVDYTLQEVPTPPSASRRPMKWVSERQRIFVLASIAEGSMVVPYRRTSHLAGSITGEVRGIGNDWVGFVGTNVVYAPWVISEEKVGGRGPQASYHSGIWYVLQKVVKDAKDGIIRIYRENVARALR